MSQPANAEPAHGATGSDLCPVCGAADDPRERTGEVHFVCEIFREAALLRRSLRIAGRGGSPVDLLEAVKFAKAALARCEPIASHDDQDPLVREFLIRAAAWAFVALDAAAPTRRIA